MKKLLVKNGVLIDKHNNLVNANKDILIEDGVIKKIDDTIAQTEDCEIFDAQGHYVSAGMIDGHVHEFKPPESFGNPDMIGTKRGVTAIIECGSVWVDAAGEFAAKSQQYDTKWYGLLSAHNEYNGISNETDVDGIQEEHFLALLEKYPEVFKGLKCVCSNRRSNLLGYPLVKKAKAICEKGNVPLTVHIGSYPPDPNALVEFLDKGDVVTHTYHGKEISLFQEDGEPKPGAKRARDRGVWFDMGHGTESYSYPVFDKAMKKGFIPDLITTDIRLSNTKGPVHSLAVVMSKVMAYMSLEDIIHRVTYMPAEIYDLGKLGQLKEGYVGDLTIFTVEDGEYSLEDCYGCAQPVKQMITPNYVVVSNKGETKIVPCDLGYNK